MSLAVTRWQALDETAQAALLERPVAPGGDVASTVARIIERVRDDGDAALRALSMEFDGAAPSTLEVAARALEAAADACDESLMKAIERAATRITAFHEAGLPRDSRIETAPGLVCEARHVAISPVGLYIPGGSAPLISTVLMLAIPARIARCGEVILCTPPGKDGQVHPAILAAARRCGIGKVFAVGGAQAIAAMAYGTEAIPRCAKIFGPGNAWVTEAKRQVAADPGGAAQDMPAGPSEVMVIADASADPLAVCWDLLSQAEHGPDSQVLLISDSEDLLQAVAKMLPEKAATLPRAAVLEQSLQSVRLVRVERLQSALDIAETYAPEHLVLNCVNAAELSRQVSRSGSVFVGPWTPESLGDYSSGTNHVLPTNGYARACSGLSVTDFMRRMTVQSASREALADAGADAMELAAAEGLEAHRMAVAYRLENQA